MKKLIMLFIALITLIGCGGGHQQEENTSEWGDSIATITTRLTIGCNWQMILHGFQ